MSVAGIKVSDIAKIDLHPSAIKRSYYSTQAARGEVLLQYARVL